MYVLLQMFLFSLDVYLDQIPHPDLVCVVNDVLVVHQRVPTHHLLLPHCPRITLQLLRLSNDVIWVLDGQT
jgi:hypothetical protein